MTPTDPIRAALERAARELELSAIVLRQGDFETFAKRAQNEAHAARATLAKEQGEGADAGNVLDLAAIIRHVDGGHRLGAAALAEAILLHPDIGLVLANSDGPAVPEGREPASVADHYSPIQEALNKLEEYDQANPYHDCRDLIAAARVALARWRLPAAPPAPLVDLAAKLIAESQPISPEFAATLSPDVLWDLYEDSAQPATPLEVKIPKIGHIFCLAQIIQESCEQCTDQEATSLAKAILEHPYSRWGLKDAPVPVSERLPEPNTKVLAHYFNALGNGRTICAIWVPAKSRSDDSADDDFTEYDEENDTYYWPEGWYEAIENWDDLGWVAVNEGEVAYWQPLPKWPAHALPMPQGEVE